MVQKMIRTIDKLTYYAERKGLLYGIIRYMVKNKEYIDGNPILTSKFYSYFYNLPTEQYEEELQQQIRVFFSEKLDAENISDPKSFNEKIQWLKIHAINKDIIKLVDKYDVRNWVEKRVGKEYLIPIVGGPWKTSDEIDFSKLPEKYVLKANHGSGMNRVVCGAEYKAQKDIRKVADCWLHTLFGWKGIENQYFKIDRKVYAEQYIEQDDGNLLDYKIHCFNGEPKIIQVIGNRDLVQHTAKEAFFDIEWNRNDLMYHTYEQYDKLPERPKKLDELLWAARKLSQGFKYVRVDMYVLDEGIKFGEMTFTPAIGFGEWPNGDNNNYVGDWIDIS